MKKILIIGAGFLQTFVIRKAKEMGYYVFCVDGNPLADGFKFADEYQVIDITDKEKCLQYAQRNDIDGVMTAATDYGVITASYIANALNLRGVSMETAALIKNKYRVRKLFYETNVDDTKQAHEIETKEDLEKIKDLIEYPVMVKPCDGSGSRGASKVENSENLFDAVNQAIKCSITKKALIEGFVVGQEYGVESLVCNGNVHVMGVMKKKMTKPPFYAELGHQIPAELDRDFEEKVKNTVKRAIQVLGITFGAVNMDLLITSTGKIHIVDVGARMGGNLIGSHIVSTGTGIDYLGNLIKATVGDTVCFKKTTEPTPIVTRLLALTPGKIVKLPDFEQIQKKHHIIIEHHLSIGQTINEYHTNLDGCGYIIASANEIGLATSRAESALKEIDEAIIRG